MPWRAATLWPHATSSGGTAGTAPVTHLRSASAAAPVSTRRHPYSSCPDVEDGSGTSTRVADSAVAAMSIRSDCCVPTRGMSSKLAAAAPTMPPTVLAASRRPTTRPRSRPTGATAATASGKLAPHKQAAGRTAHKDRARSSWNWNAALVESAGFTGQYGRPVVSDRAAQRMAPTSSPWQTPSAARAVASDRAAAEPTALPMPRPSRNTARMSENVYTVAPSSSDSRRVHTTSAPRAVMPEIPMAIMTGQAAPRAASPSPARSAGGSWPAARDRANAPSATATLTAAADTVATVASNSRSK